MAKLHKTALPKKVEKQKVQKQKQSTSTVRRSSRLKGKMKTTKGPSFIDLSSPGKDATSPSHTESIETSPPRVESPFEHELEVEVEHELEVEHEPEYEHQPSPRKSPEVDPDQ